MLHFHNTRHNSMINDDEKNILGIYCLFSGVMEVLRHQALVVNYFFLGTKWQPAAQEKLI